MEILFPKNINCIFCNIPISLSNDLSLCKNCYKKMQFIEEICIRCGRHGEGAIFCTQCAGEIYYFDRVYSVLAYNNLMHSNIYKYKYGHKGFFAEYFGELLKRFAVQNELKFDYATGVPIARKRIAQRGYNQSYLMAQKIDHEKFIEILIRKKETKYLSQLSKTQRIIELSDAFQINGEVIDRIMAEKYAGQEKEIQDGPERGKIRLLIVDDILTTGSTANEMSKIIKKHMAHVDITVLTLCNARK